ncbi:hypothetical protein COW99_03115 [Candidatus Roizmanbacteria bacterium CG22_combo_CG10-13_8_21_14_all_38_20]|uniref:Trigger factor n=1 Tax=Candidatus Roizmanbacteria bacterium CG22_combo_CG10-13_8_21_14_all_38_20 TaxID=1974862 RepID=A0A2H0BVI5_9BACT|nr:hypothetical protein [Candidatus Microgenomates bacterium]PIP61614.1 MAG: hypothetical protein COW99_03115 [Candidatus Roizmanbacteria bacterium CG22_combo_CG10-13_8_21_14_all_38_20]PJC30564.1 MAG: hypothetical protein CO050_05625 [Candidatus Roizmanbacteria bacterium CG_4_9_14_0_2_um_filter_38_17]
MQTEITRQKDGAIDILLTILWKDVKIKYDSVVEQAVKHVVVKGFRKGKAPKNLAEQQLDLERMWQQTLEELLPVYYAKIVQQEKLQPVIQPRIQLQKAAPDNDLVVKITTAEKPVLKLGKYKKAVTILKKASKDKKVSLDEILGIILKEVELTLPVFMIEEQTNKELSSLIDQAKQVGMTIEKYAQSKGLSIEQLKVQKKQEAENTLKLEFILESIADEDKITVEDKEVEDFFKASKESLSTEDQNRQRYFVTSLIRRRKTLQHLLD